ncbi:TonB family protein [Candidatus Omnitrophota bacterium]
MIKTRYRFKIRFAMVFVALFCFACVLAQAGILDDMYSSKEIVVIIGEVRAFKVQNPQQVKIGNPRLLDVVGAGRSELLLSGLKEGETQLIVVDEFGQHSYTVKIFKEDLEKVKERIDVLLEASGYDYLVTKIEDKERRVFITGEVPASKREHFESRLNSVKDKIIDLVEYPEDVPSIQIDVEVLEISKTAMDEIGFEWGKTATLDNARLTDFLSPSHTLKVLKFPWQQDTWDVTINFLKQRNEARTLSRPKIVCLSGKEATLHVGGERPYVMGATTTTTDGGTVQEVEIELKEYGLTLSIKPTVKENDEVQVSLSTELREIDESVEITVVGVANPGFTTTSTDTELTVMNGQTVFLAGLMKSKMTDVKDSIAGLSSIPFLGALFRNKDYDKVDTEIVITLTPTIIRNTPIADTTLTSANTAVESRVSSRESTINAAATQLSQRDDPVVSYSNLVQNIINSNIRYPQELRDENIEGSVKLSLHLRANGELTGVVIMQPSGSALLDEAAEYSVKRLSPFPAFPSQIKLKELWIDMPIVYKR